MAGSGAALKSVLQFYSPGRKDASLAVEGRRGSECSPFTACARGMRLSFSGEHLERGVWRGLFKASHVGPEFTNWNPLLKNKGCPSTLTQLCQLGHRPHLGGGGWEPSPAMGS